MGRKSCTEPQCLYKGARYLHHAFTYNSYWQVVTIVLENNIAPIFRVEKSQAGKIINPYPTAFPYGNGMVLHFYQQQESSTTKTVHKVINKGLKTYV